MIAGTFYRKTHFVPYKTLIELIKEYKKEELMVSYTYQRTWYQKFFYHKNWERRETLSPVTDKDLR